ncbi:hypothetical protein D9M68_682810 [compost metagenome]
MTAALGSQTPVACGMASSMSGFNGAWVGRPFAASDGTEVGARPDGCPAGDSGAVAGAGWGSGAGASQVCRYSVASNTSAQWPQRTQPSEIFNWSGTTLNIVPQAGQRVVKLMPRLLQAGSARPARRPRRRHQSLLRIKASGLDRGHQDPAILFVADGQSHPGGIGLPQFIGLPRQNAGQHQVPTGAHMAAK